MLCALLLLGLSALSSLAETEGEEINFGPTEFFGNGGRLFAKEDSGTGIREYYVLNRREYATEDSRGKEGNAKMIIRYSGGGYEMRQMKYLVRCVVIDDDVTVSLRESHVEPNQWVTIRDGGLSPPAGEMTAYNLYWAVCHDQFQKLP